MQIIFRIRETRNQSGETIYIPERGYIPRISAGSPAGQNVKYPEWVNITIGFGYHYYMDFEAAKARIKEYVDANKKAVEKIYWMSEFDYLAEDPKPIPTANQRFNHSFESLEVIQQHLQLIGITNKYIIDGLENSIKNGYYITKRIGGTHD
jgi:hypothetical protein